MEKIAIAMQLGQRTYGVLLLRHASQQFHDRQTNGEIVVIDFDETNILLASFALFSVRDYGLPYDLIKRVTVPGSSIQNLGALGAAAGRMVMSSALFYRAGRETAGGQAELNSQGNVINSRNRR